MNKLALALLALVSLAARAETYLKDKGCYLVSGRVVKAEAHTLRLRVFEGTRSEAELTLKVEDGDNPHLPPKSLVRTVVYADSAPAPVAAITFLAEKSNLKRVERIDTTANWTWLGRGHEGKCGRVFP